MAKPTINEKTQPFDRPLNKRKWEAVNHVVLYHFTVPKVNCQDSGDSNYFSSLCKWTVSLGAETREAKESLHRVQRNASRFSNGNTDLGYIFNHLSLSQGLQLDLSFYCWD